MKDQLDTFEVQTSLGTLVQVKADSYKIIDVLGAQCLSFYRDELEVAIFPHWSYMKMLVEHIPNEPLPELKS